MFSAVLLSLVITVPQSPWIVDSTGRPGTHFTDLPAAVAAAAHGDTILVRARSSIYTGYSAFSISGKALTIRGEQSGSTFCYGATIGFVPPGSVFTLEGMTFGSVAIDGASVAIAACSLQIGITNGSHVAMSGSYCGGSMPANVSNGSTLVATASQFAAPNYGSSTNTSCMSHISSPAILATDSRVILHNCRATGGWSIFYMSAGAFGGCLGPSIWQHPGIDLWRSTIRVTGGATNISGSSAIAADAASQGTVHGNVGYLGVISPQIVRVVAALPDLTVGGSTLPNGEILTTTPVTVALNGTIPGAPVLIAFAPTPPVATNLASLALGEVMLPVSHYFLAATLDGTGQFMVTLPGILVPWIGVPVFGQAAVLDAAAGQFLMSNLSLQLFTN